MKTSPRVSCGPLEGSPQLLGPTPECLPRRKRPANPRWTEYWFATVCMPKNYWYAAQNQTVTVPKTPPRNSLGSRRIGPLLQIRA